MEITCFVAMIYIKRTLLVRAGIFMLHLNSLIKIYILPKYKKCKKPRVLSQKKEEKVLTLTNIKHISFNRYILKPLRHSDMYTQATSFNLINKH